MTVQLMSKRSILNLKPALRTCTAANAGLTPLACVACGGVPDLATVNQDASKSASISRRLAKLIKDVPGYLVDDPPATILAEP
jgi:hypothetical protein